MADHPGTITIGDWSQDGHNSYTCYDYTASHPVEEQQTAYYRSVETTGIRFHDGVSDDPNVVCAEYNDDVITGYHLEILRRYAKVDGTEFGDDGPDGFIPSREKFARMILWFIGQSLPGFRCEPLRCSDHLYGRWARRNTEESVLPPHPLNGWWNEGLNRQFGYGLFDNIRYSHYGRERPSDRSDRYRDRPFFNLTSQSARFAGRIVCDFDHEVRLTAEQDGVLVRWNEEQKPLVEFLSNARGRIVRAGPRYFFTDERDAVLFKLLFA